MPSHGDSWKAEGAQVSVDSNLGRPHRRIPLTWTANPLSDAPNTAYSDYEPQATGSDTPSQPLYNGESYGNAKEGFKGLSENGKTTGYSRAPPIFKRRIEATNAELFFDLFFVANLTVFTLVHELNSGQNVRASVGFFTILWFTWLQVTLYETRFSADSIFDRVGQLLHYGVMIAFAVVGPDYAVVDEQSKSMRQLTIILMVSRVILLVQYLSVLVYARHRAGAVTPLVLKSATLALSVIVYIGIFFSFREGQGINGQIGWYLISVFEALSMLTISCHWKTFSFRDTCLPQRLGLLTLIILGEGIIGFSRTLALISDAYGSTTLLSGMAISAIFTEFFLFVLYFDQVDVDRFGTIREHIWALSHYALHLAILLTLEGVHQWALYSVANQQVQNALNSIDQISHTYENNTDQFVQSINDTLALFDNAPNVPTIFPADLNQTLTDISDHTNVTQDLVYDLIAGVTLYGFQSYGYHVSSFNAEGTQHFYDVVITAFIYLFIAAGGALLTLAFLLWVGKRDKTRAEYCGIAVRIVVGVGLCLITLMDVTSFPSNDNVFPAYLNSGLVLPTVMLSLGLVLFLDKVAAFFLH